MGDICPPHSVNKNLTPRFRNTCPMMSPLFISIIDRFQVQRLPPMDIVYDIDQDPDIVNWLIR
jgi:hypothetical protein